MSQRNDSALLSDVINAIDAILRFTNGMDYSDFVHDERTTHAVIHDFAVIGEASKNLSPAFRNAHPEIPWADMARTRDKLTRGYFDVSHAVIWKTIHQDLPKVRMALLEIQRNDR